MDETKVDYAALPCLCTMDCNDGEIMCVLRARCKMHFLKGEVDAVLKTQYAGYQRFRRQVNLDENDDCEHQGRHNNLDEC